MSYGLSEAEIARLKKFDERRAKALVQGVARKLKYVSLEVALITRPVPASRRGV